MKRVLHKADVLEYGDMPQYRDTKNVEVNCIVRQALL